MGYQFNFLFSITDELKLFIICKKIVHWRSIIFPVMTPWLVVEGLLVSVFDKALLFFFPTETVLSILV